MQIFRYKVRANIVKVRIVKTRIFRKLVDSEELSPEAITEIGLWKSVDSHRNYYKISKMIRVKSARIISSIM